MTYQVSEWQIDEIGNISPINSFFLVLTFAGGFIWSYWIVLDYVWRIRCHLKKEEEEIEKIEKLIDIGEEV